MSIEVLKLLAEHGGIVALLLGIPYLGMSAAVVVLWRQSIKDKERLINLIESQVEKDAKLEAAFVSLKELINARGLHSHDD